MDQEIPYEEKLKSYSLSDLINIRYTMNSEKYPERYKLLLDEIKKRKQSVSYYDYKQFRNNETIWTIINNSKVFNDIKKSWKHDRVLGFLNIIISPIKIVVSLSRLILFTLYNYYQSGKNSRDYAYFSSIGAFMLIVFCNLLTLFTILNIDTKLIVLWDSAAPRWEQYLQVFIYYSPFYIVFKILVPERKIINYNYSDSIIFLGKIITISLIILSTIIFIITAVLKNG